jgi:GDP-D-mannose dehydratase
MHIGTMEDSAALKAIVGTISPNEIYHLAAHTHVGLS